MNNSLDAPTKSGNQSPGAPSQVPWTMPDVWLGLILGLIWILVSLGFSFARERFAWQFDIGYFLILWEFVLLLPAWWLTIRKYRLGWDSLGIRKFDLTSLAIGCGLMIFTFTVNFFYNLILLFNDLQSNFEISELFSQFTSPWLLFVTGILVAPLVEEIFFRGFLFTGLRKKYGWITAALVSAALFAVFHLQPIAMLPIFLLGLVFAYLYQRTESIWPGVILHMATNTLSLSAAYLISQMESLTI